MDPEARTPARAGSRQGQALRWRVNVLPLLVHGHPSWLDPRAEVNLWHIAAGPSGNLHELVPRESVTEGGQRTQWDLLTTCYMPDKVPSSSLLDPTRQIWGSSSHTHYFLFSFLNVRDLGGTQGLSLGRCHTPLRHPIFKREFENKRVKKHQ